MRTKAVIPRWRLASFRNRAFWQAQAIWADQVSTGELPAAPVAVQRHVIAQYVAGVRFGHRGSGTVGHPASTVPGFALVGACKKSSLEGCRGRVCRGGSGGTASRAGSSTATEPSSFISHNAHYVNIRIMWPHHRQAAAVADPTVPPQGVASPIAGGRSCHAFPERPAS